MMEFTVHKRSSSSRARLGVLRTPHGEVETPAFVTVATQGAVKALTNAQTIAAGTRLVIANTLHLHLKPGEAVVKAVGGLHRFMAWERPIMTDSGGFQVFSLGFGRDLGMGKVLKEASPSRVVSRQRPKLLDITDDGVLFTSYIDGGKVFVGPKESMEIQAALGADIIFAFDECTAPVADKAYTREAMERTHRWATTCLAARDPGQALFGIVQGGKFPGLRRESARVIGAMPFEGFGIGGEFGDDKRVMSGMLRSVIDELPDDRLRHLLGIGHPDDIARIIREGVDTFDCTVPTHYARHGTAFTSEGRLDLAKPAFLSDDRPLDPACGCFVCREHTRAYVAHLVRLKEMTGATLLTCHNLHHFNELVRDAREAIKRNEL